MDSSPAPETLNGLAIFPLSTILFPGGDFVVESSKGA